MSLHRTAAKRCSFNSPDSFGRCIRWQCPFPAAVGGSTLGHSTSPRMKTQWEYTTLKLSTDFGFFSGTDFDTSQLGEQLNAHGADGWELVSIFDIEKVQAGSKFVVAVMKRPKA
jgi:hypothetical protein